jgi:hypothetical protein
VCVVRRWKCCRASILLRCRLANGLARYLVVVVVVVVVAVGLLCFCVCDVFICVRCRLSRTMRLQLPVFALKGALLFVAFLSIVFG